MFFTVGVSGVILGAAVLLRSVSRRYKVLALTGVALVLAGLGGTIIVAAAGPGGFGHNMMGMGGTSMIGSPSKLDRAITGPWQVFP